jgi:hypothetical protein
MVYFNHSIEMNLKDDPNGSGGFGLVPCLPQNGCGGKHNYKPNQRRRKNEDIGPRCMIFLPRNEIEKLVTRLTRYSRFTSSPIRQETSQERLKPPGYSSAYRSNALSGTCLSLFVFGLVQEKKLASHTF